MVKIKPAKQKTAGKANTKKKTIKKAAKFPQKKTVKINTSAKKKNAAKPKPLAKKTIGKKAATKTTLRKTKPGAKKNGEEKNNFLVLVINPGSTSTKMAVYKGSKELCSESISHDKAEIDKYPLIVDQHSMRHKVVVDFLTRRNIPIKSLSAVVDRGGLLKPISSGTYVINQAMLTDLKEARRGEHISNVGAFIAKNIADAAGCPAYIVDAVSVDEFTPLARVAGLAEFERKSLLHALNMRMAAMQACLDLKKKLTEVNLIVAHLGGGISISPVDHGKFVDVNNANEGGPFSPERAGGVPVGALVKMCYSGRYTIDDVKKMLTRSGGLSGYLGTNKANQVKDRVLAGDEKAEEVFRAMAYQVAKEIGACATVLKGKVDAIVLTGGVAHNKIFTDWIKDRVYFICPKYFVYPGEDEMPALAAGAQMVLKGEEKAREY